MEPALESRVLEIAQLIRESSIDLVDDEDWYDDSPYWGDEKPEEDDDEEDTRTRFTLATRNLQAFLERGGAKAYLQSFEDDWEACRYPEKGKPLDGRTTTRLWKDGGCFTITLHGNQIVHIMPVGDDNIRWTLNSCGWRTPTTKERMNDYIPFSVYQTDFKWHIQGIEGGDINFSDRIELHLY
jgi:hypothetical protein